MRHIFLLIYIFTMVFISCKSFILDEQYNKLKNLEKKEFILIEALQAGEKILKKDEVIMIIISKGDDWIKAEAYSSKIGKLKSDRIRLLYLFEDDFPNKKFDLEFFNSKLLSMIKVR